MTGLTFAYETQKLTNEDGKACFNFKLAGKVRIESPCVGLAGAVVVKGSKKVPNCCHNSYGQQLVKHHVKNKKKGNKCEKAVIVVKGKINRV